MPVCFAQKIKKQKLFFFIFFSSKKFQNFSSFFQKIQNKISRYRTRCRESRHRGTRAVWFRQKIPELSSRGDFESDLTCFTVVSVSTQFLSILGPGITCYMNSTGHNRWGISKELKAVGAGRGDEFRQNPCGTGNVSNGFQGKSVILDSIEGERCVSLKLRLRAGVSSSKGSKDNEFAELWVLWSTG